ncbi:CPBP family intramembrane glutamic endopeptidase [Gloeocapsa sp. PCC 73106]|uniref:CPBP family intramembrane glutamic endopeptidase n=1 Tax=Gloeocapsa sp. PCC 73106 TaxID=102232 RepID=UPI0002AD149A|nr:type II CAAX endopeptidase family protein [Gloeocapsa sp. PCC 73106]ELR97712.1 putative metal-dependent membrane protease [Gloeocapsa sp. PCC 73106]
MTNPNNSDLEPLTRVQILVVMGVTALILLMVAKVWQKLDSVTLLPWELSFQAILWGLGLALLIILSSSLIYRLWPAYRHSADSYLELVLKPLTWSDLIWLGLLPGLSEELLFRGVMLSALGLNLGALIISSCIFGILHMSGSQQWPYAIWATIVGLMLGYAALITNNLLVPIIAHIVTNICSSLLWKMGNKLGFPSN